MNALARDEDPHSVWCLVDVPHYARLSRLNLGRARVVSLRGLMLSFFFKICDVCIRTY